MVVSSTFNILSDVVYEMVLVMGSKSCPDYHIRDGNVVVLHFFRFIEIMSDPAKAGKVWEVCLNDNVRGYQRRQALYRLFWKSIQYVRFDGSVLFTYGHYFNHADRMLPVILLKLCSRLLSRRTTPSAEILHVLFPLSDDRELCLMYLLNSESSLQEDRGYTVYLLEILQTLRLAGTDFSYARDLPVCTAAHVLRSIRYHYKKAPSVTLQFVLNARNKKQPLPDEALASIETACICSSIHDGIEDSHLLCWLRRHYAEAVMRHVLSMPVNVWKNHGLRVLGEALNYIQNDLC